jgi:TatD DNase family protein
MLIDSHAHLTMPQFDGDRGDVLDRARDAGVTYILTVGTEEAEWTRVRDFARDYAARGVYAAIGVHPHDAGSPTAETWQRLGEQSSDPRVVAIGEIGLDFHYMNSPAPAQEGVFRRQIRVAREVGLPIVVHSRKAERETVRILEEEDAAEVGGVVHCFSGDLEMARQALALGFFISFSGSLTFKNAGALREIALALPVEKMLIETDCPYLAPQPVRGERNEPAYVGHIAAVIAELKRLSIADVARITSHNAMQLFSMGSIESEGKIAYQIRDSLYLNVTNRCTNACGFCIRSYSDFVKGHHLRLSGEPGFAEVVASIGDPRAFGEVVFCGYGEPLIRLDLVKEVAGWIKARRGRVRVNTNGQGNLIHGRNILPELNGLVDAYSISLNTENEEKYMSICKPAFGPGTYGAVIDFIREARKHASVSLTVLNLPEVDLERCRQIAEELQVGFRMRYYDVVG